MNVLSLFDGMSCGQIALEKLGIPVKNYFAAEIDKYAIQVAKSNYPDTIHVGDVKDIHTIDGHLVDDFCFLHKIDLLIGGSPCQGFSFAGKQLNFDDPRSQLFFEYVRLLKALKPKYFLMENVKMKKESMDIITEYLGVEPIEINSNLVSAQNRKRLYWTNIPMKGLPEDKGIILKDILEPVEQIDDAYYYSDKSIAYMERGNAKWQQAGARRADRYTQTPDTKKAFTITANFHKGVPYNYFDDASRIKGGRIVNRRLDEQGKRQDYDKDIPLQTMLEIREDDKTNCLTTVHKDAVLVDTLAYKDKFSSGLILADVQVNKSNRESLRRVYETEGKSPTLMASTGGHTQPKIRDKSKCVRSGGRGSYDRHEWDSVDTHHIRKLTVTECERLQTVPDGYTCGVSNTQRYKMLGNGWTVDVVKHIFEGLKETA